MAVAVETKGNTETALARFDDVRNLMSQYDATKFIRLVPTVFQERSELYRPAAVIITVDPEDPRDVYDSPARDKTVCLRARKLDQIGGAIGVRWLDTKYDRKTPDEVTAHVYAEVTDAVGDRIPLTASATEYMTARTGRSVSTYPLEKAESRAKARLVKKLTGLPTSFTKEELKAKNFVGLRWRLDERVPEVRDAIIKAGTQAAATVFGASAEFKAIDAGHEGPDETPSVQEGDFTEQPAPVADEPAIPETPDSAPDTSGIQTLVAQIIGRTPRTGGAAQASTDEQQANLGVTLRDVLALKGHVSPHGMNAVRLAFSRFIYGNDITSVRALTNGQARTLIDLGRDPEGQQAIKTIFAFALEHDPKLAIVREELGQQ